MTELSLNRDIAKAVVRELYDNFWIDRNTRAVFLDFVLFNPNVNLYVFITALIEFPLIGNAITSCSIQPVRVYITGFQGIILKICEVIFLILTFLEILLIIYNVKLEGRRHLTLLRVLIDLSTIILTIVFIVLYNLRLQYVDDTILEMKDNMAKFVPFRVTTLVDDVFIIVLGGLTAIAILKFLLLMRLVKRIAVLAATLRNAFMPLLGTSVAVAIGYLSFISLGFLFYHSSLSYFSTIYNTVKYLISLGLGKVLATTDLFDVNSSFTIVYMMSFVIFSKYILLNFVITIILNIYETFKHDPQIHPRDHLLVDVLKEQMVLAAEKTLRIYMSVDVGV